MRRIMAVLVGAGLVAAGCGLPGGGDDPGREPVWRARLPSDDGAAVGATAGSVIVRTGRSVVGLDRRTGRQRWSHQGRAGDTGDSYVDVAIAGDVVAVGGTKTGEGRWLEVLDAASGRSLWTHRTTAGRVTVLDDAVYTADCSRECVVSRRDPRTGRTRWSVRSAGDSRIEPPELGARIGRAEARGLAARAAGPFVLLREGDGRSAGDRVTVLDSGTGRRLAGARYTGWTAFVTGAELVVGEPADEKAQDPRCPVALRAYDVRSGRRLWTGGVSAHFSRRDDKPGCSGLLTDDEHALGVPPDLLLATTADGRPQAFDLATGRSRWAASEPGVPVDAGGPLVLVRDARTRGPVRALDVRNGRQAWQTKAPRGTTVVTSANVLVQLDGHVTVLDPANGHPRWSTRGDTNLVGAGDTWFATKPYLTRTPEILFYDLTG